MDEELRVVDIPTSSSSSSSSESRSDPGDHDRRDSDSADSWFEEGGDGDERPAKVDREGEFCCCPDWTPKRRCGCCWLVVILSFTLGLCLVCLLFWFVVTILVGVSRWSKCTYTLEHVLQQPRIPVRPILPSSSLVTSYSISNLQLWGTHNSYHKPGLGAGVMSDWRYSAGPISEQLELGARSIELDIHWVPESGRFAVYHLLVVDSASSVRCIRDALFQMKEWSMTNDHQLILVKIEPKNDLELGADCTEETFMQPLHDEILSVFRREDLLTPQDVMRRGNYSTLRETVMNVGWPNLNFTRGRFLFLFTIYSSNEVCRPIYEAETDKLLFIRTTYEERLTSNDASVITSSDETEIAQMLSENFLVYCSTPDYGSDPGSCLTAGANYILSNNPEEDFGQCNSAVTNTSSCTVVDQYLTEIRGG